MKSLILTFIIVIGLAGVAHAGWGDVSGNGWVTPYDASLIMRHLAGDIVLPAWQLYYADVDDDGDVDDRDVQYIMLYSARLIFLFPVQMHGWPVYMKYHPLIIPLWYWDFEACPVSK